MNELDRRRTLAIISHPDAGKTTLTEKLLLYGGAVQLAGSVTARKNQRATTSDWMELERQRGISVSSTVLQFDYAGCVVNLLDTPGHRDFSEDTYRVLHGVPDDAHELHLPVVTVLRTDDVPGGKVRVCAFNHFVENLFKFPVMPVLDAFEAAFDADLLLEKEKKDHYMGTRRRVREIIRLS